MKSLLIRVQILGLIAILVTGCSTLFPSYYSSFLIDGWIVNEETKEPLEGAIVVIQWIVYGNNLLQGSEKVLMTMESITDKTGYFYFSRWGPKAIPEKTNIFSDSPRLTIFKSGYHWKEFVNSFKSYKPNEKFSPDWHGKTIELKPFKDSLEEYAIDLGKINESLMVLSLPQRQCGWKIIPNMVLALEHQRIIFENAKINSTLRSIDLLGKMSPKSCGSPRILFRGDIK